MAVELDRCEALADLTPEERAVLAKYGERVDVAGGTTLMREGDPGDCFYIVLTGRLEARRGDAALGSLLPGAVIGEMALFNDHVRTAAVVALADCELLRFDDSAFLRRVLHHEGPAVKLMAHLGRVMADRLQADDAALAERAAADPHESQTHEDFAALRRQLMSEWALTYHAMGLPGKLAIRATKPAATAADLSVAYSPGVAEPCLHIAESPEMAYELTSKGHLVGVVSNGTAVLGLGDIGPLASKPVMEGKAVLFKRFGGVDAFDVEVAETDPDRLIDIVCAIAPTFGGINLEDIKAPECFRIERECQARLDIPVFHDDQHGTAIISGAGLVGALELVGKDIADVRVVFSGAGAAGFSCARFFLSLGVRREHLIMTDRQGVVHPGREDVPGTHLAEIAADTPHRTLAEAIAGADVFVGVSAAGVLKSEMLASMAPDPVVFALANPVPEIDRDLALRTRPDAIVATGRSDYPNQVNNVIAFPYIFRGALDCRATAITESMKVAASKAISALTRQPVTPDAGFDGAGLSFGREYLIPKPFDRRLLWTVAPAVAAAAAEAGIARTPLDPDAYAAELRAYPPA